MKIIKKLLLLIVLVAIAYGAYEGYVFYNSSNNKTVNKKEEKTEVLIKDNAIKNSIFKKHYKEARKLVSKMSTEEKVGQLFLVRYNVSDVEYLSNFYPGGYILFAKDFENHTKESIKKEIDKDQSLNKYPLIIGVDEEGGFVTRVSRFTNFRSEKFASPRFYYDQGGYQLVEQIEKEKAELLLSLGINLNLAPVADISTDPNDFINSRAFGKGTAETSEFIKNMVGYANKNKINSCLKHFPGYGNNIDTHTGIAIDERSYDNFVNNDFKPFEAGIKAGVPSVLISHNVIKNVDPNYPASLSKKVIDELRNTLDFTGIIMTDDLAMDAVKSYVEDGKAATLAINAGNDMIITSDFMSMKNEVIASVESGTISEDTLNEAATRVIAWKYYSGLFDEN